MVTQDQLRQVQSLRRQQTRTTTSIAPPSSTSATTEATQSSAGAPSSTQKSYSNEELRAIGRAIGVQERYIQGVSARLAKNREKLSSREQKGMDSPGTRAAIARDEALLAEEQAQLSQKQSQLGSTTFEQARAQAPRNLRNAQADAINATKPVKTVYISTEGKKLTENEIKAVQRSGTGSKKTTPYISTEGKKLTENEIKAVEKARRIGPGLQPGVYALTTGPLAGQQLIVTSKARSGATAGELLDELRGGPFQPIRQNYTNLLKDKVVGTIERRASGTNAGDVINLGTDSVVSGKTVLKEIPLTSVNGPIRSGSDNRESTRSAILDSAGVVDRKENARENTFFGGVKQGFQAIISPVVGLSKAAKFNPTSVNNFILQDVVSLSTRGRFAEKPAYFSSPGSDPDIQSFMIAGSVGAAGIASPVIAIGTGTAVAGSVGYGLYKDPSPERFGEATVLLAPIAFAGAFRGARVIEEFRFSGAKTDIVGAGGTATRTTTIIAEKKTLPFSQETLRSLKSSEPDFLVLQGNTRGVVTSRRGTGILADVDQPFLVKNPFLEPLKTVEFNTIPGSGTFTRPVPNQQFGFPIADIPRYPIGRPSKTTIVKTPDSVGKQIVSESLFFKISDTVAKAEARIKGIAKERLQRGDTPILNAELFFEKFTPRTSTSGSRFGAELFNEQGMIRLPSPRIRSERAIVNVEAPLFRTKDKNIVGRIVQEQIKFRFETNVPRIQFFQEGAAKIATAFRRPRDAPRTTGTSGRPPTTIDLTKRGDGSVDPRISYYPVTINGKTSYVPVQNPYFRSAVDLQAAKRTNRANILKEAKEAGAKKTTYAAKSGASLLLQEAAAAMRAPLLETVQVTNRPVLFSQVVNSPRRPLIPLVRAEELNETTILPETILEPAPEPLPTTEPATEGLFLKRGRTGRLQGATIRLRGGTTVPISTGLLNQPRFRSVITPVTESRSLQPISESTALESQLSTDLTASTDTSTIARGRSINLVRNLLAAKNAQSLRNVARSRTATQQRPNAGNPLSSASRRGLSASFDVFLKRFGYDRLIASGVSRSEALALGSSKALGGLGATFKLRETGGLVQEKDVPFDLSKFRDYRIVDGKRVPLKDEFIQKRGTRLGSLGERREIKAARKRKSAFFGSSGKKRGLL